MISLQRTGNHHARSSPRPRPRCSLSLGAGAASAADQVRSTAPFTAIDVQGPISVTVDASAAQRSLTVRGSDKFLNGLSSEAVNGELRLRMRDKGMITHQGDQRVVIAMPQLRAFNTEGAGETNSIRCAANASTWATAAPAAWRSTAKSTPSG
jgi:hypothetical protein